VKKKSVLIIFLAAVILCLAAGITDFALVRSFNKPIFCIGTDLADDGGSGKYVGLGYSFDIKGNFLPDTEYPGVTSYHGYIFGNEVTSGLRD